MFPSNAGASVAGGICMLHTPFSVRKDFMAKCAQLAQFDEELYKVAFILVFEGKLSFSIIGREH